MAVGDLPEDGELRLGPVALPAGKRIRAAVAHVHFHVAGTLEEGGTTWGDVPRLSVAETDALAERLRQVEASLPDSWA